MQYIKYKKITYILSEEPGLSGQIAFEFLKNIVDLSDSIKFIFYGHGKNSESLGLLKEMYDNIIIQPSKNNEESFIISNFYVNSGLLKLLCSLGKFPNFICISKFDPNNQIDYWSMEYSDEFFTFIYNDKFINYSRMIALEQELLNKGIVYERKVIKNVTLKAR